MCGMRASFTQGGAPVDAACLRAMSSVQAHRGPDGESVVCRGSVGLGHRRLAIIDLVTGDQPMANEEGSVWIVFNGEIHNFRELRRDLEGRRARSVIYRRKQGFAIPLAQWLRGDLRGMAEDLLVSPRSVGRGYLRPDGVRQLWRRHQRGVRDYSAQLWALVVLELWHRTFVEQNPEQGAIGA